MERRRGLGQHVWIKKGYLLLVTLTLLSISDLKAQQQYIITQYMFNGLILNPAYAGSHESWSFTLMSRHQWAGIEGAPTTQSLAAHGPINNISSSMGLLLVNDQYGAIKLNNVYASYAYRVSFSKDRHLSLGLQGGFSSFEVDLSRSHLIDHDDPAIFVDNTRSFFPNAGTGIYYSDPRLFVGFSVPFILNNRLNQSAQDLSRNSRHYYFNIGSTHKLNHSIKFKPSFLLRYVRGVPVDIDVNSSFVFNDVVWLGVTYRLGDSFDFIMEIQFTDNLRFGYSFDLTTSELSAVTSGSHEFVLNYRIKKKHHKVFHPRHF